MADRRVHDAAILAFTIAGIRSSRDARVHEQIREAALPAGLDADEVTRMTRRLPSPSGKC